MTRQETFDAWAPPAAIWSPWVKPVLFASLPDDTVGDASPLDVARINLAWVPAPTERVALVLDLPGAEGALIGVALAASGYRPIPLYNAHPGPRSTNVNSPLPLALVDTRAIAAVLAAGTSLLRDAHLPFDAPPAFLLDADRRTGVGPPTPGRFDNRSISFPTDFPSANLLLSHGIHRALLLQQTLARPQEDLAHTLRRWAHAGIRVQSIALGSDTPPADCNLAPPSCLQIWWHSLTAAIGLRRNPLGGFGGLIPIPSAG